MYDPRLRHTAEGEFTSVCRIRDNVLRYLAVHRADGVGRLEVVARRRAGCGRGLRGRFALEQPPDAAQPGEELRVGLGPGCARFCWREVTFFHCNILILLIRMSKFGCLLITQKRPNG